jgi:hypothetical protein
VRISWLDNGTEKCRQQRNDFPFSFSYFKGTRKPKIVRIAYVAAVRQIADGYHQRLPHKD